MLIKKIYRKIKKKFVNRYRYPHIKKQVKCNYTWYGNSYGGFYLNSNSIKKGGVIYSFGIGEDISFDMSVIEKHNSLVFGFDPTPKSIEWISKKNPSRNFTFYPFGISEETGKVFFNLPKNTNHISGSLINHNNVSNHDKVQVEMKSMDDIHKMLNHESIDVIKMDIEGSEYSVIESILNIKIPISQIVIEFHERFFPNGKKRSIELIKKMNNKGYKIFAISDSYEEISFIHETLV